jgi:hypothetical protein
VAGYGNYPVLTLCCAVPCRAMLRRRMTRTVPLCWQDTPRACADAVLRCVDDVLIM